MSKTLRNTVLAIATAAGLALSPLAVSHLNDKEIPQSYRQSWYAMIGANFGPMVAMVKGEMPWDERQMAGYADQLAALTTLDVMRGFSDGSDKGTTRALLLRATFLHSQLTRPVLPALVPAAGPTTRPEPPSAQPPKRATMPQGQPAPAARARFPRA